MNLKSQSGISQTLALIMNLDLLRRTAFAFPAVDNHAHPLLSSQFRYKVPLEAIFSEASGEVALKNDATQTLACFRAAAQLAEILDVEKNQDFLWGKVKEKRDAIEYEELCEMFMQRCGIQSILLDDGLGGVSEWAEDWKWHRRFCHTKRMVRIEIEAEVRTGPFLYLASVWIHLMLEIATSVASTPAGHRRSSQSPRCRVTQKATFYSYQLLWSAQHLFDQQLPWSRRRSIQEYSMLPWWTEHPNSICSWNIFSRVPNRR